MRVLYVVEATIAGVRRHVTTLVRGIDRQRFQVAVACPPQRDEAYGDCHFVADLRQARVDIVPLPMRRAIHPPTDAAALGQLINHLRAESYDIVHAHSSKAGFLARLAALAAGRPATVYTPHGLYFLGIHSSPKRRFYLALEQFAARLTDRIIAVSVGEHAALLRHGIGAPEQVVCIENGVRPPVLPPEYDRAAQRCALFHTDDMLLIGSIARLVPQKNPFLFVEAAALVLRNQPNARFVWCGDGELAQAVQQRAAALGIGHACRWLGHREDAANILAALDLFWLTSEYEGAPYVVLEAMALGVPIIATDVIGSRDMLRGVNGLLVPPRDAAALQAATRLLAAPDRRARLAGVARAWYHAHGTPQRMLCATQQIYAEVAGLRGAQEHTVAVPHA